MNRKKAIITICLILLATIGFSFYSDTDFLTGAIKKIAVLKKTPAKTAQKVEPIKVVKRQAAPEVVDAFPVMQSPQTVGTSAAQAPAVAGDASAGASVSAVAPALSFDQVQALKYYADSGAEHKQMIDLLNQVLVAVKNQPAPYVVYQQIPVQTPVPVVAPAVSEQPAQTVPQVQVKKDTLDEGLVGHWTFEEGSGAVAADTSGNNNNGNVEGDPTWIEGKVGGALYFDGIDDRVVVPEPDSDSLDISKSITLSLWVKPSKITDCYANQLLQKASGTGDSNFNLYFWGHQYGQDGMVLLYTRAGGKWQWVSAISRRLDLDEWQHVAITYQSGEGITYVNSVPTNPVNATGDLTVNNEPLYIGYGLAGFTGGACGQYFNGAIDDVRIYDRVLSPKEISQLSKMK